MADKTLSGPIQVYDETEFRVVMLDPNRSVALICTDYSKIHVVQAIFEQGYLEIECHIDSPICTTEDGSGTAMSQDWLNWSFDVYWRGYKMFSGPVSVVEVMHQGNYASARAHIYCTTWFNWLLGGRVIETSTGGKFSQSATAWDDIWRELVRTNTENGNVVAPTEYPVGYARDDFGPFTVTVAADTSTASTDDYKIQAGKPLLDSALELCNTPAAEADMLYPTVSETSAGTFQFDVEVGRSGGSRGIGSDKTGTIIVSGFRGTVGPFKKRAEHNMLISVARVGGKGVGSAQLRRYVTDATTKAQVGVREDGVTIHKADTNAECDNEARRQLWEQKLDNAKTYEFMVMEQEGAVYGTDFTIRDSITCRDVITQETTTQMIVGAEVEMSAPGPPSLKLIFGKMPRSIVREAGRSGGGLRGAGRSGGGPPKDSEGDDSGGSANAYRYIQTQGSTVDAEGIDHYLKIQGADTTASGRIFVRTAGTDSANSDASGTPDVIDLYIEGEENSGEYSQNAYVLLRRHGGGADLLLLAHDPSVGPGP